MSDLRIDTQKSVVLPEFSGDVKPYHQRKKVRREVGLVETEERGVPILIRLDGLHGLVNVSDLFC